MSAILEYMLEPANVEITSVNLRKVSRRNRQHVGLEIEHISSMKIESEKGNVLYTAGRPVPEHLKHRANQYGITDDDNVVREWYRACGCYTEEDIEKHLDEMKNGPLSVRRVLAVMYDKPEEITKQIDEAWARGDEGFSPSLIPVGYRKERLSEGKIFQHPVWSKIYWSIGNIHIIEGVKVGRARPFFSINYNLGVRMSPQECKVIQDTYLQHAQRFGFNPKFPHHPDNQTLYYNKYTDSIGSTIQFWHSGDISPLSIWLLTPANSNGISILREVENKIASFNPATGEFSREIEIKA